ncbi:hypothetical protein [Falsibacillus pallidus]|uniref:Peptide ABC transporter permease n=1 Tax=Falsibacillus pallidus TaxID=493781 RepID=A0A370G1Z8_9BACI|nr:hypothetical protein [Falsibacillus pallidus]RDI37907.1 hypothetical protein DFR59_1204 [Falsibacillus pallidus]
MSDFQNQLYQDIAAANKERYWPGFELVAFAVYDHSQVYLFNHPKFKTDHQRDYHVIKRNEQFNGCTLILYEEYPTAIVDLSLVEGYEDIYSILIHELFHGFQYLKGENRFPDEMKGITYPLLKENIELRNRERINLFNALIEEDKVKKKQYLNSFIALRELRASKINEYLEYETLIETVEGPAWYVELKAYSEKSSKSYSSVLKKYGQSLLDIYESTSNLRRSCYSSGLFMCLLLDEFSPDWKDQFLSGKGTLYDIFKLLSDEEYSDTPSEGAEISLDPDDVIHFALEKRENEFKKFQEQKGVRLNIFGEITARSFDPMNIITLGERMLHNNFLKIRINNEDYLLQQPVIAYSKNGLKDIYKLNLIIKSEPVENIGSLAIEGVGEIKGRVMKQGNSFNLFTNE